MDVDEGVQFAVVEGRRSSQRAGTAILADAVRAVDADLASQIENTTDWRKRYIGPFAASVAAGARSSKDAVRIATDGLDSLHRHLTFVRGDQELRLDDAFNVLAQPLFETEVVEGRGPRVTELESPTGEKPSMETDCSSSWTRGSGLGSSNRRLATRWQP